ncbi:hypothetical protein Ndes2526B_g05924 [Nannochloris sp. 'desiccata']|nr:hypothetical protein KSW81_007734 [Chlorella desiccata (nom. nud.)]
MADLWKNKDPATWEAILDRYYDIVANIGKDRLLELEMWFQEELPEIIKKEEKLSSSDIVRLVEWKVGQRGKFRPRLLNFAKDLTPEAVSDASLRSFNVLSKFECTSDVPASALKEALAPLTELKGIGPATASAALSAAHPSIPFMSDEAMQASLGYKDYTVKAAVEVTAALQKKAKELSAAAGGGGRKWTARAVEQCLFAVTKEATGSTRKAATKAAAPKKRKR